MNLRIREIRKSISNGETKRSLDLFISFIDEQSIGDKSNQLKDKLISLRSQVIRREKDFNLGLISYEEKQIGLNKENHSILRTLNEYFIKYDEESIKLHKRTIIAFSILSMITFVIVLVFGNYFYIPRQQSGVPTYLFIIYTSIFFSSAFLVLLYTYLSVGLNARLLLTGSYYILLSYLFLNSPYFSTVYIQKSTKQEAANSRFEAGNWEDAMYIYIREKHKLTEQSKENIIDMKRTLNDAAYYIYDLNDEPDIRVLESLYELQKKFDLHPDGFVGRKTRNVLYGLIYYKELNLDITKADNQMLIRKVVKFQRSNNLYDDGVIGPETLKKLKEKHEANTVENDNTD